MTKKTRILLFSGIGIVALAVVLVASTRGRSEREADRSAPPMPIDVETVPASMEQMGQPFEIGGDVRAREAATISSRIVAPVTAVLVKPGDRVRKGQALIRLDARDLTAGRARAQASVTAAGQAAQLAAADKQAAEAALALASATYRRVPDLRQKNSATPSEMDDAQAALRAAEARVKSAEAQLAQAAAGIDVAKAAEQSAVVGESYATLLAPFDGVVTQKLIDPGNMAAPGVPLLTVEDNRAFRLEVRIDESRASLVTLAQPVDVVVEGAGAAPISGRVSEVARVLDPNAHSFLAKIELPAASGLRAGMYGRARFAGPARRALTLPEGAVVRRGQLTSVFVVDRTNTARLRLVTLGESLGGRVEVQAGLDEGEAVVSRPPATLADGAPVRARALGAIDTGQRSTDTGQRASVPGEDRR